MFLQAYLHLISHNHKQCVRYDWYIQTDITFENLHATNAVMTLLHANSISTIASLCLHVCYICMDTTRLVEWHAHDIINQDLWGKQTLVSEHIS